MKQLTLCICILLSMIGRASSPALAEPPYEAARKGDTEQALSAADQGAPAKAYLIVAEGDVNSRLAIRLSPLLCPLRRTNQ